MEKATTPRPPDPLRRFYSDAAIVDAGAGVATVVLDGRPVRTPRQALLTLPTVIAKAVAAEWDAQESLILPLSMPVTRLANTAIDGVASALDAVKDDVAAIAGNDLVIYRADAPDGLVAEQSARWDPVVQDAETRYAVRITLAAGVMPVQQDARFTEAVRADLPSAPLPLAALHQLTTLTGSALIALAVAEGRLDLDEGWRAAHVDEDWNIREWGEDAEAAARRAQRRRDAEAAAFVLSA